MSFSFSGAFFREFISFISAFTLAFANVPYFFSTLFIVLLSIKKSSFVAYKPNVVRRRVAMTDMIIATDFFIYYITLNSIRLF